jgi:hypothetical protein
MGPFNNRVRSAIPMTSESPLLSALHQLLLLQTQKVA